MVTLGEYVSAGFSQWIHLNDSCQFFLERLIGISVICKFFSPFSIMTLFTGPLLYLTFFSLGKLVGRFQIVATSAKIIVAAVIIVTGFIWLIFKGDRQLFKASKYILQEAHLISTIVSKEVLKILEILSSQSIPAFLLITDGMY